MKKLEDIPKKNVFEVPEGYFDRLPGIIQARVSKPEASLGWNRPRVMVLRYALAAFLMTAAGIFWYTNSRPFSSRIKTELASIAPEQLVEYLDERDVTTEDLVEEVTWNSGDLNDLENSVYSDLEPPQEIEKILNEYDDADL